MATGNKFEQFVEDMAHKIHDLESDTLKVMLTLTAPVATNAVKANLTEISAGDGYTAGGDTVAQTGFTQASGTYKLTLTDNVWTASAGTFADFRFPVLYNDTPAGPVDPLMFFWDHGSTVDLGAGETYTWDQDGAGNGVMTLV